MSMGDASPHCMLDTGTQRRVFEDSSVHLNFEEIKTRDEAICPKKGIAVAFGTVINTNRLQKTQHYNGAR